MKILDYLCLCLVILKVADSNVNIFLAQSANLFILYNFLCTKVKRKRLKNLEILSHHELFITLSQKPIYSIKTELWSFYNINKIAMVFSPEILVLVLVPESREEWRKDLASESKVNPSKIITNVPAFGPIDSSWSRRSEG